MANSKNPFQGDTKKVICVCSAGLLRSPTLAHILSSPPYNYNTRAVGLTEEYALIHLEPVHLYWANEVLCMEQWMYDEVMQMMDGMYLTCKVYNLDIPDNFRYRDPKLIELLKEAYETKVCQK